MRQAVRAVSFAVVVCLTAAISTGFGVFVLVQAAGRQLMPWEREQH